MVFVLSIEHRKTEGTFFKWQTTKFRHQINSGAIIVKEKNQNYGYQIITKKAFALTDIMSCYIKQYNFEKM